MDIIAHSLWTAAVAKATNKKVKKPLNVWIAAFWGVFPDLYAFTIPFIAVFLAAITGRAHFSDLGPHGASQLGNGPFGHYLILAEMLYNISHSLVTFTVFFLLAWIIIKRPFWEMSGWLLHILIDIPTHKAEFFPTPVFWPLSEWRFTHGISWGTWQFQIINYGCIVIVFILLRVFRNKKEINNR